MNFRSWAGAPKVHRANLLLNFPNQSRSLDVGHGHVSFWGYSSTIEVTFLIGVDVLREMTGGDEGTLETFDRHRTVIEKAAGTAYSREHATFCRLERSDF